MKCFYHSADLDGHCSGAIVKKFNPDCEMIGWNYGQEFPNETIKPGEQVFVVDVSLPIEKMVMLAEFLFNTEGQLHWIDHHIGIIRDYKALPEFQRKIFGGRLRPDKAACELCWEYFTDEPIPAAVEILGIYDSWRFTESTEEVVKQFQYGMRTIKETRPEHAMATWEDLFENKAARDKIMDRGRVIWDYQNTQNEKTCRACAFLTALRPVHEGGLPLHCIAVNSNLMNSDVFKSVYDPKKHDAMLCFYRSKRGFWRVSIYSTREDVDCSRYTKIFGGGGHKGAAGFQCLELPFELTKMASDR